MEINIKAGKYVVGVSGGVDSVSLLHALAQKNDLELVVAHVDHGIREDSGADLDFVKNLADKYGFKFASTKLDLGPNTSEALAREKRYKFFNKLLVDEKADAIITAHHQNDLIETAIINLLRGTKRRGLSSLKSTEKIIRPLLQVAKTEILEYAKTKKLSWREDPTNTDESILRNYLRENVLRDIKPSDRMTLLNKIQNASIKNEQIDKLLDDVSGSHLLTSDKEVLIDRNWYILLPAEVRLEVLMNTTREMSMKSDIDSKQLKYLDMIARTGYHGTAHPVSKDLELAIWPDKVLVKAKTL